MELDLFTAPTARAPHISERKAAAQVFTEEKCEWRKTSEHLKAVNPRPSLLYSSQPSCMIHLLTLFAIPAPLLQPTLRAAITLLLSMSALAMSRN